MSFRNKNKKMNITTLHCTSGIHRDARRKTEKLKKKKKILQFFSVITSMATFFHFACVFLSLSLTLDLLLETFFDSFFFLSLFFFFLITGAVNPQVVASA